MDFRMYGATIKIIKIAIVMEFVKKKKCNPVTEYD
jgi:hypothetical protein